MLRAEESAETPGVESDLPAGSAGRAAPLRKVLVLCEDRRPPEPLARVLDELECACTVDSDPRALFQFPDIRRLDMVLVVVRAEDPTSWNVLQLVAELIAATHVPLVGAGEHLSLADRLRVFEAGARECLTLELPAEELKVRLNILTSNKQRLETMIDQNVQTILMARRLRESAERLDEELRLARRLQMDFLPRRMPEVGRARFAARLYPAGWVSGDFYHVFRLDEEHVGFYVADAIGHGVPAALLTIFVKQALQTKRIGPQTYGLIPPNEALALLNGDLLSAELEQSPFISMVYCVLNGRTGRLQYARAGHPRPLLLRGATPPVELPGDGPLLGVTDRADYQLTERELAPGQRLLLYTDGVERARTATSSGMVAFFELAAQANSRERDECLKTLLDAVLAPREGEAVQDDVTVLVAEMGG